MVSGSRILRVGCIWMGCVVTAFGATTINFTEDVPTTGGCSNGITAYDVNGTCTAVVNSSTNPLESGLSVGAFTTTGGIMAGMDVTVIFSDGNSVTGSWVASNTTAGNFTGSVAVGKKNDAVTITQKGDTYTASNNDPTGGFVVTNSSTTTGVLISEIIFDGTTGSHANCAAGTNAVYFCGTSFDRTPFGAQGAGTGTGSNEQTPSSNIGLDFQVDNGKGANGDASGTNTIAVTYSKALMVTTVAGCDTSGSTGTLPTSGPCLDEWTKLDIKWNATQGVSTTTAFTFDQDTDTPLFTPEPSSFVMAGTGMLIAAICFARRSRLERARAFLRRL